MKGNHLLQSFLFNKAENLTCLLFPVKPIDKPINKMRIIILPTLDFTISFKKASIFFFTPKCVKKLSQIPT